MTVSAGPSGFPDDVPISRQTYQNWARTITVDQVWTCTPRSEDDVVRVCNWAARAGYAVRARGIMHGWSPLTITEDSAAGVLLVDMTALGAVGVVTPATGDQPAQVEAQAGATMDALMSVLEYSSGGSGDIGFGFPHVPAPGHITVGGALAIDAHGTGVPTHDDAAPSPYGSLSNQILAFTAVVTEPGTDVYVARTFTRAEADAKAFLTHCGRALLLAVTLQVVENYNLRCQSLFDDADTLFAPPVDGQPQPGSVGAYLNATGRVEVIWFPPLAETDTTRPWLKVWSASPTKPSASTEVYAPYNYGFSDDLPPAVTSLLKAVVGGGHASLTPMLCRAFADYTMDAASREGVADLWGPSKNTLLYVRDRTLLVTANGYAVAMGRAQVQQAIADVTEQFRLMLLEYQAAGLWPINAPLEIRVTGLDEPSPLAVPSAESPTISALRVDADTAANGWDTACWFDVLTVIPEHDPQRSNQFYAEFEAWIYAHFADGYRVAPEWSKGWAYTPEDGPWTNETILDTIRSTYSRGRPDADWAWTAGTLSKYDAANVFRNPFLERLFAT